MIKTVAAAITFALGLLNAKPHCNRHVETLVSKMTLEQKIGQMTQLNIDEILNDDKSVNHDKARGYFRRNIGSLLNSPYAGGPVSGKASWTPSEWRNVVTEIQKIAKEEGALPMLYGIDSVHGANYIEGAVIFPQQINGAAAFNPDLVYEMGRITAKDTLAAGIPWIFGPILGISVRSQWARVYETFGEDPYVASVMGAKLIQGLQMNNQTAACMKHFIGYSNPTTGHDRDNTVISDFDLLNYFAPSFQAAIKAGVLSGMEAYSSLNGVPMMINSKMMNSLLRDDMKYQGMMVTDWAEINNLYEFHRVAKSKLQAVEMALERTSIDMSMVPLSDDFIDSTLQLVRTKRLAEGRITESAERVVQLKYDLGLLDTPVPGAANVPSVGSPADREAALNLARESIVLLKNRENMLPLPKNAKIFLTGPSADNIGFQCSGWTMHWQGTRDTSLFPYGKSIKEGLETFLGRRYMDYEAGIDIDGKPMDVEYDSALARAAQSDYTIVAIGEPPYTEKLGDITDLNLPSGQIDYVKALARTGTRVIVVLIQGRTRLLQGIPDVAHAVIHTMLPCEGGGQAVAEIIYGETNPSGRLPLTYPKHHGQIDTPYYHRRNMQCNGPCPVEWVFGSGLSYTTFTYSNMRLSSEQVKDYQELMVSVDIENTGPYAGKETVLLFLSQAYRSNYSPEVKMLKKFTKLHFEKGQKRTVQFVLSREDWGVYEPQIGEGFRKRSEAGLYGVAFKHDTDCDLYNSESSHPLCQRFTLH